MGKIDLGTVDLAVQEEGVCSQDSGGNREDNCQCNSGGLASTGATTSTRGNLSCSLVHSGKNVVDVVASTCIGVKVVAVGGNSGLASSSHFINLFADLRKLDVLVLVVVSVVVVV